MGNDFSSIEDLMPPRGTANSAHDAPQPQAVLSEKIHDLEQKKKEEQVATHAAQLGLAYTDLHGFPILLDAIRLIPKQTALDLKVVCFLYAGDQIRLGMVDESKRAAIEEISTDLVKRFGAQVEVYLISESSFDSAMKSYDFLPKKKEISGGVEITEKDIAKYQEEIKDFKQLASKVTDANLSEIVVMVLSSALKGDASDVHIEAAEKNVIVRFRIDGVLHDVAEIASSEWAKLISRLKLVAHLKLNVTTRPQDGRFTIFLKDDKVEVRVSTIPTAYGESVVMRLLKASSVGLEFEQLGVRGRAYEQLLEQVKRPNGMIIATGPTGCGKTTTLYAILNLLNSPETKIITLEDPVEYKLQGINQSQIDKAKDYTFAKGLRSILRQDPDVVMVGEIRDGETADIAVNAALTGHVVISTIHTNSAAGAIPRFLAMDAKPFLLAPALNAVVGQRLVRKICADCKEGVSLDDNTLKRVKDILAELPEDSEEKKNYNPDAMKFYKGGGCDACGGLGYRGRIGMFEILIVSPEVESMVLAEKVSEYGMEQQARQQGMITMVQDGLLKALDGITSVEEIFSKVE